MAVCVAVISRQNYPLYMRTIPCENKISFKFHFIVHSSLDVIEERMVILSRSAEPSSTRESYLGFLFPIEDYKVYGYVTNCKVKFVLLVESSNLSIKDLDIKEKFQKLHNAYSDAVSNPFYINGKMIKSTSFDKVVNSVMAFNHPTTDISPATGATTTAMNNSNFNTNQLSGAYVMPTPHAPGTANVNPLNLTPNAAVALTQNLQSLIGSS